MEKTCENCEYEIASEYGLPCVLCIHNKGEVEKFTPKKRLVERHKVVNEFAEKLTKGCIEKTFKIELNGVPVDVVAIDNITELIFDVAELMKGAK